MTNPLSPIHRDDPVEPHATFCHCGYQLAQVHGMAAGVVRGATGRLLYTIPVGVHAGVGTVNGSHSLILSTQMVAPREQVVDTLVPLVPLTTGPGV